MEKMEVLTRFAEELTLTGAPVVFTGATIARLALKNNGLERFVRETRDIDINWVDSRQSVATIMDALNRAARAVDSRLMVTLKKEPMPGRTLSIAVGLSKEKACFDVDLAIECVAQYSYYRTDIKEVMLVGASVNNMLADKVSAISQDIVVRRVKDIYDVFTLSMLPHADIREVGRILEVTGMTVGDFSKFYGGYGSLEHAYRKRKGLPEGIDFHTVYTETEWFIRNFRK